MTALKRAYKTIENHGETQDKCKKMIQRRLSRENRDALDRLNDVERNDKLDAAYTQLLNDYHINCCKRKIN
jgi:hypothetical protein